MHILVVEDNKDLLSFLSGLLASRGHTVVCKDNAADAMDYCRTAAPGRVDIVLTDFMLGSGTAEGLITFIKGQRPVVRVLVMSAGTAELKDRLNELYDRKIIDLVIGKPFEIKVLSRLIESYAPP